MFSSSFVRSVVIALASCAALSSPAIASVRGGVATPLTLINGWQNGAAGAANASVLELNGIVHFKGAISQTGSSPLPFVLPAQFRPSAHVYIPITACKTMNARLDILPDGTTAVETEGDFDKGKCFVSLDGATFALSSDGARNLKLRHRWTNYSFGAATVALQSIDSMVHFQGAMHTGGKNPFPFILPVAYRPPGDVYVKADLCNATNGRLLIEPDGTVTVESQKQWKNAKCFTSLDGISYAPQLAGATELTLINGWANYFSAKPAAIKLVNGVVQFQGALFTSGPNPTPFMLPPGFRPSKKVYVPVDMCGSANGRIEFDPDGTTIVHAEKIFGDAQCFTSLEGVTFLE